MVIVTERGGGAEVNLDEGEGGAGCSGTFGDTHVGREADFGLENKGSGDVDCDAVEGDGQKGEADWGTGEQAG